MHLYDRRRYDYFRRLEKSQTERFTALIVGHKFEILDVDKVPKGKLCKCAFCGQYCKYYVLLRRDDGLKVKIGRTCMERAGLMLRPQDKKKIKELQAPPQIVVKQENAKAEKTEVDLDDDLLRMLDDL